MVGAETAEVSFGIQQEGEKWRFSFYLGAARGSNPLRERDGVLEWTAPVTKQSLAICIVAADQVQGIQNARMEDAALFDRQIPTSAAGAAAIFIVGMPRSGSSLIEQILAAHSDSIIPLNTLTSVSSDLRQKGFKKVITKLIPEVSERSTFVLMTGIVLSLIFFKSFRKFLNFFLFPSITGEYAQKW